MNSNFDVMHTLAWSLLHFLWQGAAIAALAGAFMHVMRTPATRYLIGIAAIGLMLASFAITLGVMSGAHESTALLVNAGAGAAASPATGANYLVDSIQAQVAVAVSNRDFNWVAYGWLAGVCVLALRIGFGLLVIEHLRRRNLVALPDSLVARFRELQQRLGIDRVVRYCECNLVRAPSVIGFFRPVVLLPVRALTGLSAEQLDAVIAHELGHIKRFDVAINFIQVVVETLFFFHPAVWWLNKRIRADREHCCDDIAVSTSSGSVGYARALAAMASWREAPAFAMAVTAGPIAARVARLLGLRQHAGARTAGVFTASVLLTAALAAGAISLTVSKPAVARDDTIVQGNLIAQAEPPRPVATPAPVVPPAPRAKAAPAVKAVPAAKAAPAVPAQPATTESRGSSYLEEMKASGLEVGVDQLIALKSQGVTTDYIREMRATGLNPDVNEIIAMKVQDITPEYVKTIRAQGFSPESHELIALKVQDISPEYIKSMRDLGIDPNVGELIALKVQDITPDYVREIRAAGFKPDAGELIALKTQDVTPAYQKALSDAGFKLDVSELIQAKVMDITPEFIARVQKLGFKNLNINQLIALKNADVL